MFGLWVSDIDPRPCLVPLESESRWPCRSCVMVQLRSQTAEWEGRAQSAAADAALPT